MLPSEWMRSTYANPRSPSHCRLPPPVFCFLFPFPLFDLSFHLSLLPFSHCFLSRSVQFLLSSLTPRVFSVLVTHVLFFLLSALLFPLHYTVIDYLKLNGTDIIAVVPPVSCARCCFAVAGEPQKRNVFDVQPAGWAPATWFTLVLKVNDLNAAFGTFVNTAGYWRSSFLGCFCFCKSGDGVIKLSKSIWIMNLDNCDCYVGKRLTTQVNLRTTCCLNVYVIYGQRLLLYIHNVQSITFVTTTWYPLSQVVIIGLCAYFCVHKLNNALEFSPVFLSSFLCLSGR